MNIGNEELEHRFDSGEDITRFMEANTLRRPDMAYVAEDGTILTDELLDSMAAEYETGTWNGHGEVSRGRPSA